MTFSAPTFVELREDVVVNAINEEGVVRVSAPVLERQHGDGWPCILCSGATCPVGPRLPSGRLQFFSASLARW